MRRPHILVAGLCAVSIFVYGLLSVGPTVRAVADQCDRAGSQSLTLTDAKGKRVAGAYRRDGALGVVLLHGIEETRCAWGSIDLFDGIASTLAIDVPIEAAVDDDAEPSVELATVSSDAVEAAVKELRRRGHQRVMLVGSSYGGAVAIVAAVLVKPLVNGVVALSPTVNVRGQNALEAISDLAAPIRIVASDADAIGEFTAADNALALIEVATESPDAKAILLVGDDHGSELIQPGKKATAEVRAFLQDVSVRPLPTTTITTITTTTRPAVATTIATKGVATTIKRPATTVKGKKSVKKTVKKTVKKGTPARKASSSSKSLHQ